MLKRLLLILSHPALISLILSAIAIILLPPFFNRYKSKLVDKQTVTYTEKVIFHDLDHDEYSEKLIITDGSPSSILIETKEKIFDHWPLRGKLFMHYELKFGDFNNNGYDEIYIFTYDSSAIYINIFEPFPDLITHINGKPVYQVGYDTNEVDFGIVSSLLEDLDGDGHEEIIFSVMTGWSGKPRQTIAYDAWNDTLWYSSESGVCLFDLYTYDLDQDGVNEIMGNTHAYNNCKDLLYSDSSTWLMVLNNKLGYFFEPVKIGKYPASLMVQPLVYDGESQLVAFNLHRGIIDTSSLLLFNKNGILLKEKEYIPEMDLVNPFLIPSKPDNINEVNLIHANDKIEVIDNNLSIKEKIKTKIRVFNTPKRIDIDLDGEKEIIFQSLGNQTITITRSDFSYPVAIEFPNFAGQRFGYSIVKDGQDQPLLCIQNDNNLYFYHYSENSLYFLKYLFYLGLYFSFLFIVWIIRKSQEYTLVQKFKNRQLISELRLKSIQNQMNPHFTLNVLNSIGTLFLKKDLEKADYVFDKYSKLLKSTVIDSDNFITTLKKEIDYVDNYLKLERFRFEENFDYKILIEDELDKDINIPKMLIHTFAENAIKHGIRHLENKGHLNISIMNNDTTIQVEIIDNGVGRKKSAEYSKHTTGKGLEILDQMISLFFDLEEVKINYEIEDLFDKFENPQGTRVFIIIPKSNE